MSWHPMDQTTLNGNNNFVNLATMWTTLAVQGHTHVQFYIVNTGARDCLLRADGDTATTNLPTIAVGKEYWYGGDDGLDLDTDGDQLGEIGGVGGAWSVAITPFVKKNVQVT
jgi:hypothetical protein